MLTALKHLPEDCVYTCMSSPVGELTLLASDLGLHALLWDLDLQEKQTQKLFQKLKKSNSHPILLATKKQLKEYFAGKRRHFDLPLMPAGTGFQKKSWHQLQRIPYGQTISYQAQAERLGDVKKARAVGMANSRNPLSIIVPCHRVIGKNGNLVGFGGGLDRKRLLLDLEQGNA